MRRTIKDVQKELAERIEKERSLCPDSGEEKTIPSEPLNVHDTLHDTIHINTFHEDVHMTSRIRTLLALNDGRLPKDDYFKFTRFLTETFNEWVPGKMIKIYGYYNVLEAVDITLEAMKYRDKSREDVRSAGAFLRGVLKNLKRSA